MTIEQLEEENLLLRKLLWLRHDSKHFAELYGDDGEMQCNKCRIDFKRDSALTIEETFLRIGLVALKKAIESGEFKWLDGTLVKGGSK